MPHAKKWLNTITKRYGKEKATIYLQQATVVYQDLLFCSLSNENEQLSKQKRKILSVLAIYRVLLNKIGNSQTALNETEVLFKDVYFNVQLHGIQLLNHLSDPFPILHPVLKMMVNFSDTKDGQEIIQDDKHCFAVNVYQCFIFDILKQQGVPELTPIFCASDDWLSAAIPKIHWQRTQTLGRGGEMCDFKWCGRKKKRNG